MDGKLNALYGISFLRKICNHPDLLRREQQQHIADYGLYTRSAKMRVLHEMLPLWKEQGHRVLIFTQGVQMLDILEAYIKSQGHNYMRLDGDTSVRSRIPLIDEFNQNESIFVFLLTTRVGGIGVNLTGADRVVIFDPDWNPSTDIQVTRKSFYLVALARLHALFLLCATERGSGEMIRFTWLPSHVRMLSFCCVRLNEEKRRASGRGG